MLDDSQLSEATAALPTLRARFRWRVPIALAIGIGVLTYFGVFVKKGPYAIGYPGLAGTLAIAMGLQYRRERALTRNRLAAVGLVTDYWIPFRGKSRILNFIVARFYPEVPRYKYSFVAFDQKSYAGKTGLGSRGLYTGAKIIVLYDPANPATNHPRTGFIFFSFE